MLQDAEDAVRLVRGMLRRGEEGEAFRERRRVVAWSTSEAGLLSASVTEECGTAVRIRKGRERLLVARSGSSPEALRAALREAARRLGSSPFLRPARATQRPARSSSAASGEDEALAGQLQAVLARAIGDPRGLALALRVSKVEVERAVVTSQGVVACDLPARIEAVGTVRRADGERLFSFQSTRSSLAALEAMGLLLQEALKPAATASAPAGETDVVLSPSAAAVFWHEVVGHPMEAEGEERGSVLSRVAGAAVAPVSIDVVDDPLRGDLPGAYLHDDEGMPAQRVPLLVAGTVGGPLTDRSAAGGRSNGHGRAPDFRRQPRARMSNLVVAPGHRREEEMVEACGLGLHVREISAGSADPESGRFVLFVERAELIRKGRIGTPVGRLVLSGDVLRALASIDGSPGDRVLPSHGLSICMKGGDAVPVGGAAPALLVRSLSAAPLRR